MPTNELSRQLIQSMKDWRHHLHANPELGFEELKTAEFVSKRLKDWGLEVHQNIGITGVIGILKKGDGQRSIALRADMDALPIEELNDLEYRSKNVGTMHACGHDGHITMLLGAAKHLAANVEFNGTVIFIFQPNEENGKGALAMIDDGLFERVKIDEVYGMHNMPGMPLGCFETRPGTLCASESLFEINVSGQGGHAAMPHKGVDTILVGAHIVSALQSIISRKIDPAQSAVISVTEFIADGRRNVLPGNALLKGDVRAMNPQTRQLIKEKMHQVIEGIAIAHDVDVAFSFESVFIEVINDTGATQKAVDAARAISNQVCADALEKTFSEDFAHFATKQPGCFMLMGNGEDGSYARPLHAADYNFNDGALAYGVQFWVSLIEQELAV